MLKLPVKKIPGGPLLLIALLTGILAAAGVYWAFAGVYQPAEVVVAARNVEALKQIGPADVKVITVSKRDRHPRALTQVSQAVGSYTRMPLVAGEALFPEKLVRDPGQVVEAYGAMKEDETLITLKSSQVSWPDILQDDDTVSVVAVFPDRVEEVAGKARVVHNSKPLPILGELQSAREAEARPTSEITLLLSREDAKKVLLATVAAKMVYLFPESPGQAGAK
ncbi:SAF domain-containing protein [Neomoorella mulderi]|uniref:Flagellar basal body P-ring biosynthesis protein FlgA n=1 Tax=Moorella mulderi DSM 14980 TaxID=1122241 RepID=A0A151AT44_9FIRM|nr:SAF domain-containing protein [Moorella mulderi]KYH30753.1 flagellar basal body P-ring biosynthesis protein FlgA [Moorella mulderi DSM 14980]